MYSVTTERPEDAVAIEALLDRSFGPDRHKKTSYRFRDGVPAVRDLCLVARQDETEALIGTLRFWPIAVGKARTPALLLGPIAIDATLRGGRIGSTLMWQGIDMAAQAGHRIIVLVGDYDYYKRFDFQHAAPLGLTIPQEKPERILCLELAKGALTGVSGVVTPWRLVRGRMKRAA